MRTLSTRWLGPALLALVLGLSTAPAPLAAAPVATVLADSSSSSSSSSGWSIRKLLNSLNNRARIVQFCVVVMAVALVILCKKFAEVEPTSPRPPTRRRNENG